MILRSHALEPSIQETHRSKSIPCILSTLDCVAMDKLLVGFSITVFPLLLPVAFSYLMIEEDDIITFYKDAAIGDCEEEQVATELVSRDLSSHQVTSHNAFSSHRAAEHDFHTLPVVTWNLFDEQSIGYQNRIEVLVITIWGISFSNFENA